MVTPRRAVVATVCALIAGSLVAGCSTTYNSSTTTSTGVVTSTTVPTGTPQQLLQNILTASAGLSESITSNSSDAKERLAYIEANWDVVKPQLSTIGQDQVDDLQRLIDLATTAVKRRRPADADKVTKFLPLVIESVTNKL